MFNIIELLLCLQSILCMQFFLVSSFIAATTQFWVLSGKWLLFLNVSLSQKLLLVFGLVSYHYFVFVCVCCILRCNWFLTLATWHDTKKQLNWFLSSMIGQKVRIYWRLSVACWSCAELVVYIGIEQNWVEIEKWCCALKSCPYSLPWHLSFCHFRCVLISYDHRWWCLAVCAFDKFHEYAIMRIGTDVFHDIFTA